MICIDFQAGTHGNYLEFVCNKFLANMQTVNAMPFDDSGASHNKIYLTNQVFKCWHYFDFQNVRTVPSVGDIISIRILPDDLLAVQSISLLRSGNFNYDNNFLEQNTVTKLSNPWYKPMLEQLTNSFFKNQIKKSYNAVKDPQWPTVETINDFCQLPQWIQDECKYVHNLYLVDFSTGDCPRWILREFFKLSFINPSQNGFMVNQENKMYYNPGNRVYNFSFASFYNIEDFQMEIENIAKWANMPFVVTDEFINLHEEFLTRQPYANSKQEVDSIINRIVLGENFVLPSLDLLKESYICAKLEKYYLKEWPTGPDSWFNSAEEIRKYMQL